MDRYTAKIMKRNAVNTAEASGQVADNMDVRLSIVKRMKSGDITLDQGKKELAAIKRNAKRNGLITRQQAWSRG